MKVLKGILIGIGILVLLAGIVFAAWYFSGGFGGKLSATSVRFGEKRYFTPKSGLTIQVGEEIGVRNPFGGEYTVKVTANAAKNDFKFYAGADSYQWSEVHGEDITHCFAINRTESGFTLGYKDFYTIAEGIYGETVETAEEVSGDIFMLEITANKCTVKYGFGIGTIAANLTAKGLTLNAHDYDF